MEVRLARKTIRMGGAVDIDRRSNRRRGPGGPARAGRGAPETDPVVAHFARFDIAIDFLDPLSAVGRIVGRHLYPFTARVGAAIMFQPRGGTPHRGLPSPELPLVPEKG